MYYCPKCQILSSENLCPCCWSKKLRAPQNEDPVLLETVDEEKAVIIESAFQENGIVFEERVSGLGGPPSQIIGKSIHTNKNLYVAYEELEHAENVIRGIGFGDTTETIDDTEEMSGKKKLFWRIISIILFVFVVWGVVSIVDNLAAMIQSLF